MEWDENAPYVSETIGARRVLFDLIAAGLLAFGFRTPHWGDALMVALAGVGNGIAQFWWTRSLSLASPSAVVPFNYLSLVWATLLGFAVWGDVPTPSLLVGSAIDGRLPPASRAHA